MPRDATKEINAVLDDLLEGDDCPHEEIVPCEDDPTYGRCTQCGDNSFPLFDDAEVEDIEGIAEEIFSYIIGRFTYVPINLQPEDRVKANITAIIARRRSLGFEDEG